MNHLFPSPFQPTMFRFGLIVAVSLLLFAACSHEEKNNARPVVVTSIAPLGDWVRQIGDNAFDVHVVVPPNASPHTFELQPHALKKIAGASAVLLIGKGFEAWSDKLLSVIENPQVKVLVLLEDLHGHELLAEEHHGHVHAANPHLWLDPLFAADAVQRIEALLIDQFPDHIDAIRRQARSYRDSLHALHEEIDALAKRWNGKSFVADHGSWVYFAKRYGIRQEGVLEEIPGREVSARSLGRLIERMRENNVTAIFADIRKPRQAADILSEETGAGIVPLDPLGSERTSFSYIELMRYNAHEIDRVLR